MSQRLVGLFEVAVNDARESMLDLSYGEDADRGEAVRRHFANLKRVFLLYSDIRNWRGTDDGKPRVTLPADFSAAAAGIFGHLAAGDLPAPVKDAMRPGRRSIVPGEERDIKIALMYVDFARKKQIADRAPVRTVSAAFGVSQRSFQLWAKQFPIDDEMPAFDIPVEDAEAHMRLAAERYMAAGRGTEAVRKRNAKQKV